MDYKTDIPKFMTRYGFDRKFPDGESDQQE